MSCNIKPAGLWQLRYIKFDCITQYTAHIERHVETLRNFMADAELELAAFYKGTNRIYSSKKSIHETPAATTLITKNECRKGLQSDNRPRTTQQALLKPWKPNPLAKQFFWTSRNTMSTKDPASSKGDSPPTRPASTPSRNRNI